MRIGIMTQPLFCNYGGIIQCYALQMTLKRMGHETIILQREFKKKYTIKGACIYYVKHIIKLLLGRQSSWHYYVNQRKLDYIAQNTYKFIDKNIKPRSKKCYSTEELQKVVNELNLNAIIVGSDQVWRPNYSPCLPNYFLNYLGKDNTIKRISYGASFGTDKWTFTDELTATCGELLRKFHAVSVREQSAIKLCKDYFNVDASQVLDPTMLLDANDYKKLIPQKQKVRGELFCYVLDRNQEKENLISHISSVTHLNAFESMPELQQSTYNLYGDIDKCISPPLEDWLSAFIEADMVVTDSFHGTVFSIIFNKPFWVIGNEKRGMSRFQSLLSMYNLEERLIVTTSLNKINFTKSIEWEEINKRKHSLQKISIDFLQHALK
ncbi:MAG: polysaccharide pyruvyl transferase family protein [Prevotella sp.]|nr:polysaccharide pyruvyl transferase family protein [Prevotella sp.]